MAIKHNFTSPKSDGGDASLVKPSNWNANHTIEAGTAFTTPVITSPTINGTIVATAGSGLVRTATKVVAANDADATVKLQADYVCDGTADDVQIQAVIDSLSASGGKIILSEGTFDTTSAIALVDNLVLRGMGKSTSITYSGADTTGGLTTGLFTLGIGGLSNIIIRDLALNGAGLINCLFGKDVSNVLVESCDIQSPTAAYNAYPIFLRGSHIRVLDNYLHDAMVGALCGKDSGDSFAANDITYAFNHVYNTNDDSLAFDNVVGGKIIGNYIDRNDAAVGDHVSGVKIYGGCQYVYIAGNDILNLDNATYITHGIKWEIGDDSSIGCDITISGNHIRTVSGSGVRAGGGWGANEPKNIILQGNRIYDTNKLSNADDADISLYSPLGMTITGNRFNTFYIVTPHTWLDTIDKVNDNIGYVTENLGVASNVDLDASGVGVIAHGCDITPTWASVQCQSANLNVRISSIDATNINIIVYDLDNAAINNVDTHDFYWQARV